jgi:cell division protein FtsL
MKPTRIETAIYNVQQKLKAVNHEIALKNKEAEVLRERLEDLEKIQNCKDFDA